MTATGQNPILAMNPNDRESLTSALNLWMRNRTMQDDQMLPCIVQSYDPVQNMAVVQPLIQTVDVNDNLGDRKPLAKIPCLSLGAGGFHIHFPIQPNDIGWIIAADRDLTLFKQTLAKTPPGTGRLHQFADGWFIPDVFRNYAQSPNIGSNFVIQTTDGTTRIEIDHSGLVHVIAPTRVFLETPLVECSTDLQVDRNTLIKGTLEVQGTSQFDDNVTAEKNVLVEQNLTVAGTFAATGTFGAGTASFSKPVSFTQTATFSTDITINGRSFMGHEHSGVQSGSSDTGGVV